MRTIGAHINTTESVILSLVGDASHANFKEVQRIIRNVLPDTGLIPSNANQSDNVNEIINGNGSTKKMQASLWTGAKVLKISRNQYSFRHVIYI